MHAQTFHKRLNQVCKFAYMCYTYRYIKAQHVVNYNK